MFGQSKATLAKLSLNRFRRPTKTLVSSADQAGGSSRMLLLPLIPQAEANEDFLTLLSQDKFGVCYFQFIVNQLIIPFCFKPAFLRQLALKRLDHLRDKLAWFRSHPSDRSTDRLLLTSPSSTGT